MRKLTELLRLRFELGLSQGQIARSCSISQASVSKSLKRMRAAGVSWPLPEGWDEARLEETLFGHRLRRYETRRPTPDFAHLHQELQSNRHLTLQLLWEEYRQNHPEGFGYSRFCELYHRWRRHLDVVLRHEHKAGEKLFVDYAGDTVPIHDPKGGPDHPASIFVAVLGASNYTYAEATWSQGLEDWLGAHVRTFEFLGGVPRLVVPDNARTGVSRACRYEPDLNPAYQEMARHYGVGVLPTRPYKPRDKAKVEAGVLIASRWILAVLRNRTFYSIEEARAAVAELLEKLNNRPTRLLRRSRRQLFEEIERNALKPLPARPYEYAEWTQPKVDLSYHVRHDDHFYSVHFSLIGERLDLRATETTVEIFRRGVRIESYLRSYEKGKYTTRKHHMPRAHLDQVEWTPERLTQWAKKTGPCCAALLEAIMASKAHPQQGFKACLGVLRLTRTYPAERIERAAARALRFRTLNSSSVASILRNNLDQLPVPGDESQQALPLHGNIRGGRYYH